jgi:hypothetical protein
MMIMLCRTSLAVIGVLFYMSSSTTAEQTASEDSRKLSSEVLSAIEGNQATLDSVRTIQAILTKNSTHTHYVPTNKDKELGSYKLIQKHKIRYDGNHFRIDQLEAKFTGDKVYRKSKPYVGTVHIDSPESIIDFEAVSNMVFIRPSEWNDRHKIRTNDMLRYQSARGATLKENILASAKNGYYFTATSDTVEGDNCVLLTCNYNNPEATLKIWIVPSKGYCIKKVQDGSKGEIDDEYTTTLKEYSPGIWWFDTVQAKRTSGPETVVCRLSVDSLALNEPIDPEIFTVWGIDISSETKIWDEMQSTMHTLAIDDAKDAAANPSSSSSNILIPVLAILGLVGVTLLGILIKGKKAR